MGTMNVVALRLWWDRDGQSQEGWIGVDRSWDGKSQHLGLSLWSALKALHWGCNDSH